MNEDHYVLDGRFIAIVKTPKDFDYYPIVKIVVGGPNRACITMEIYRTSKIAYLSGLGFNQRCAIGEALERSNGTRDMLRCALVFLFTKFPYLDGINFRDTSTIMCRNRTALSLYLYNIAVHGKTWYERYFFAKLQDKSQRALYKQMKAHLGSQLTMPLVDFKLATGLSTMEETLDAIYTACLNDGCNYIDMFKRLNAASSDCIIFTHHKWLDKFMESIPHYDFMDAEWMIKKKTVIGKFGDVSIKRQRKRKQVRIEGGGYHDEYLADYAALKDIQSMPTVIGSS